MGKMLSSKCSLFTCPNRLALAYRRSQEGDSKIPGFHMIGLGQIKEKLLKSLGKHDKREQQQKLSLERRANH